jgi:hypothetical protein
MDAGFETLYSVGSILIFLATIPALWISGRIILRNPISQDRSTRLFLWLALGGFFLIALVDLISLLRDVISLAIPSDQNATVFPLFLGTTSWQVYVAIVIAMGIIIYSFAVYYGQQLILKQGLPVIKELTLSSLEQGFIVLGLAGLFNHMIRGIVLNFIWLRIPMSTSISSEGYIGSFVGWIIALLVLAIVIIFMNGQLKSENG